MQLAGLSKQIPVGFLYLKSSAGSSARKLGVFWLATPTSCRQVGRLEGGKTPISFWMPVGHTAVHHSCNARAAPMTDSW
jgi:hypothetical protein